MAEIGSTLPYFEHIRIIEQVSEDMVRTGQYTQEGELMARLDVYPGIKISVATYMNDIKGPSYPFQFPSKKFFQDHLASMQAIEPKSEQITKEITATEAVLNRSDITWCETFLEAAGLPALGMLWADVYSDSLNLFPRWADANRGSGGIPVVIKPIEWDIRVPVTSAKAVTLKVGMYSDAEAMKASEVYELLFLDSASAEARTNNINAIQARISDLDAQIAALPEGPSSDRTRLTQDKTANQNQLAQLLNKDVSTIANLMNHPSVQEKLGVLLASLIQTLKAIKWPELDADLAISKLPENLAAIN
jgi:hypothetical protein